MSGTKPGTTIDRGAKGETEMWYFAWVLGLPLAAAFAVLNAMWFEMREDDANRR